MLDPRVEADDAVRAILETQWRGEPMVRLDSPPGAGKTGIVERLVAQAVAVHHERCMVVTQTNEQSYDLARRLADRYCSFPITLFVGRQTRPPRDLYSRSGLRIVKEEALLPAGPSVTIANAAKWSWLKKSGAWRLQIIDEAFQLPEHRFHLVAGLAERIVMVGDPGQIRPVVTCDTDRWRSNPTGPHVPAPHALALRQPGMVRLALPVSRRLVPDTVELVQPAFYPDQPFRALAAPGDRVLHADPGSGDAIDRAIDLAAGGLSVVGLQLPARVTGPSDPESAAAIAETVGRLIARGATLTENGETVDIGPGQIGVVCAHVVQVADVRKHLPAHAQGVLVETADRFQGLERQIMLVHHPLSGREDAGAFHVDAGRLCVMLSRHRVACLVMYRSGVDELLDRYVPEGNRPLGISGDQEFEGVLAHRTVIARLQDDGRTVAA